MHNFQTILDDLITDKIKNADYFIVLHLVKFSLPNLFTYKHILFNAMELLTFIVSFYLQQNICISSLGKFFLFFLLALFDLMKYLIFIQCTSVPKFHWH